MADIIVYSLAYYAASAYEKVACLRSPLIPITPTPYTSLSIAGVDDRDPPPPLEFNSNNTAALDLPAASCSAQATPVLTEHQLNSAHHQWSTRHAAVWLRACALIDAKSKGYPACWAGEVTRENLRAVRAAVDEARWVEERLKKALEWCEERKIGKMKLVKLVRVRKGRRSSVTRPTHTSTPPSLLDLPFPLPDAPPSNRLVLTVPRPPPLELDVNGEEEESLTRPPLYTQEADWANGETSLEGGYWGGGELPPQVEEVVQEGLDVVGYERTRA
ncbi:hypothetical protein JCM11641_001761 [Rhodosporidiobolus odoratus]